jgi:alanine dehydrogenase
VTLILTRSDVRALLGVDDCFTAVEEAFRQLGDGRAVTPGVLGCPGSGGGFHIKAGVRRLARDYFAAKINGNFRGNEPLGLPRIQGVVVLSDGSNGSPLAIIDSIEITRLRTAAATAVATRYLAAEDADTLAICGCGEQASAHIHALARVRRLRKVFAHDLVPDRASRFAEQMARELDLDVVATDDLRRATLDSQIVVTCTPSQRPFITREHVRPGAFVAGVGADSEDKSELDPDLLRSAIVVTDIREQCAHIGDLHHALTRGVMSIDDVHAELGEIVAGRRRGRASRDEIIVFDSTGMALQDVAAAAAVYERASKAMPSGAVNFAD